MNTPNQLFPSSMLKSGIREGEHVRQLKIVDQVRRKSFQDDDIQSLTSTNNKKNNKQQQNKTFYILTLQIKYILVKSILKSGCIQHSCNFSNKKYHLTNQYQFMFKYHFICKILNS
ncbi:hypothetical protein ABPG72_004428 [Tetrahymena utriculariae]